MHTTASPSVSVKNTIVLKKFTDSMSRNLTYSWTMAITGIGYFASFTFEGGYV